jgi:AcrR family transcriptional regulator
MRKPDTPDLASRSKRGQLRQAEILEAACQVFLDKGYEGTLVSEIATRVGVVEGNVFRYFPSKRELLNAVLHSLYEPLIADVDAGFARIEGFRARLQFLIWRHIRVYTETPGLARLVLHEVRTLADYPTSVLHDLQLRYTDYLRQTLEQGLASGEIGHDTDFEMLRAQVYGGLEHLMWPMLFSPRKTDVDATADRFTDAILHGISRPKASSVEDRLDRLERLVAQGLKPGR